MWRTSPRRYWPVTTGRGPLSASASAAAMSPTVRGVPEPTLKAHTRAASSQQEPLRRHVADMDEIAPLIAVLEHLGRLAAPQRRDENRGDARIGRVARHAGTVDVVIAQRGHRTAGHRRPVGGIEFLRHLAAGVSVARIERRRFITSAWPSGWPQSGHGGSNCPAASAASLRGAGRTIPCSAQGQPFAIDHHRTRKRQPRNAGARHFGKQHGRTGIVGAGIVRQVVDVDAKPDFRGKMNDGVDACEGAGNGPGVAHVGRGAVRRRRVSRRTACTSARSESRTRTVWPRATSSRRTWRPINPAPPVSRTFIRPRRHGTQAASLPPERDAGRSWRFSIRP